MNRLSLILMILLVTGLASCKSHKSTVVRATGKPTATATAKATTSVTKAPSVPKNAESKGDYANDKKITNELVKQARTWIGTPYKYGANTKKKGSDCSGFTMSLFKDVANLSLPRNSAAQCEYCFNVPKNAMQPGDLVFFTSSTRGGNVTHVGLYIGDGKMIHASTSRGVIESGLDEKYYASHYHSSGRVYGITYAATGGKKQKSGDKMDIQLASEGVKASATGASSNKAQAAKTTTAKNSKANNETKANKTSSDKAATSKPANKSTQSNDNKRSVKAQKGKSGTKTGASAVAVAPVSKSAGQPGVEEMTLDEFVAKQQSKPLVDTVIVVEHVIEETVAVIDSASAMVDSVRARTVVTDSLPAPENEKKAAPTMMVNGKPVVATQVEREDKKKAQDVPADTVRAEAIKEEVVKAMRFGK